jgi:hypothetical protein
VNGEIKIADKKDWKLANVSFEGMIWLHGVVPYMPSHVVVYCLVFPVVPDNSQHKFNQNS